MIAAVAPKSEPSPVYHPTPKINVTQPRAYGAARSKPPTTTRASPPTTAEASLPTASTASPPANATFPRVAPADPGIDDLRFSALFDRVAETAEEQLAEGHGSRKESPGRTLDDLLQSPVWELELTCSPIRLSPASSTQRPTHADGARLVTRRLFTGGQAGSPRQTPRVKELCQA